MLFACQTGLTYPKRFIDICDLNAVAYLDNFLMLSSPRCPRRRCQVSMDSGLCLDAVIAADDVVSHIKSE
jgi:hypothetical protein